MINEIYLRLKGLFDIWKSVNVIHYAGRTEDKNHMFISAKAEKNIWQNPTYFFA